MKLASYLISGITAYITYNLITNRQTLVNRYQTEKKRIDDMIKEKDNIQKQVAIIKTELNHAESDYSNIKKKIKFFKQDLTPRLDIIKERTEHMQTYLSKMNRK